METYWDFEAEANKMREYKGVFYKYDEPNNRWTLSDDAFTAGTTMHFNADIYRIDQAISEFIKEKTK